MSLEMYLVIIGVTLIAGVLALYAPDETVKFIKGLKRRK